MSTRTCGSCKKAIDDRSIVIAESHYHPACFSCGKCRTPIAGKFFPQDDGSFVCVACGAERCGDCGKAIEGARLEAGGTWFHPECFKCNSCKKPISGKYAKWRQQLLCLACRDVVQQQEEERSRAQRLEIARRQEEERRQKQEALDRERQEREARDKERRDREADERREKLERERKIRCVPPVPPLHLPLLPPPPFPPPR